MASRMRTETSLRLWMFAGLCGFISVLLIVALLVENAEHVIPLVPSIHVFVPNLSSLVAIANSFQQDAAGDPHSTSATMTLVETLPVGDVDLNSSLPQTFETLIRRTNLAQHSIDISAMYWNLLGEEDRKVYSDTEMLAFGADRGIQLFHALEQAVGRGVTLRIVTAGDSVGSPLPSELQQLVDVAPARVVVRQWSGGPWYGGGILHQKIWIFDNQHVYVGSANMDWKSLAQVMEMGVVLEGLATEAPVIKDFRRLFDVWWMWSSLDARRTTTTYNSTSFQATLKVPSWSSFLSEGNQRNDPFASVGLNSLGNIKQQLHVSLSNASAQLFVASSPIESTVRRSRTFDEAALVYTIRSAQKHVSLSVMDFTPYSMYSLETHKNASIWWPALTDAILAGVYGKPGLRVRLLISQWQHSHRQMFQALQLLDQQASLCKKFPCGGSLEIKIFRVPGWQNTTSTSTSKSKWPSYTRVNHAKYIVSDKRVNIGTSNMEWGYFYTTAGISVNTDHEPTRQAMEDAFNRNWASPYAVPLSAVTISE